MCGAGKYLKSLKLLQSLLERRIVNSSNKEKKREKKKGKEKRERGKGKDLLRNKLSKAKLLMNMLAELLTGVKTLERELIFFLIQLSILLSYGQLLPITLWSDASSYPKCLG